MLKIGLLGAGFMGNTHSQAYRILENQMDIGLYAVADIRSEQGERISKIHNAKYYKSAEELICDSEIDVVDICLPTYLHAEYAKAAMNAGKDVFLEKPAVLNPKEGELLLRVQKETGANVMVGQCIRMWPAYQYLKKLYDTNKYGRLKTLVLKRVSTLPAWGFENWYANTQKSGGAVLDLHIHDLDYMLYLLGEPQRASISGDSQHIFGIYNYEKGPIVQIEGGWDHPSAFPFSTGYRAGFEEATVEYAGSEVIIYTKDGRQFEASVNNPSDYREDLDGIIPELGGYYNELKYFYECLLNKREIQTAPLSEGVKSVNFICSVMSTGGY